MFLRVNIVYIYQHISRRSVVRHTNSKESCQGTEHPVGRGQVSSRSRYGQAGPPFTFALGKAPFLFCCPDSLYISVLNLNRRPVNTLFAPDRHPLLDSLSPSLWRQTHSKGEANGIFPTPDFNTRMPQPTLLLFSGISTCGCNPGFQDVEQEIRNSFHVGAIAL